MKKRLLSAFLAVMMVLTMAPVAFAANSGEVSSTEEVSTAVALQTALTNATDGTVIKLTDNITVSSRAKFSGQSMTVTLDLNNYTLTGSDGDYALSNENGNGATTGKLIVKNGTIKRADDVKQSNATVRNYGQMELNNVQVQGNYIVVKNEETATLTMNNCTLTAPDVYGDNQAPSGLQNWGTATANNCTIKSGTAVMAASWADSKQSYDSNTDLNDCTISGSSYAVSSGRADKSTAKQTVNVNGGSYTGNIDSGAGSDITINAEIKGKMSVVNDFSYNLGSASYITSGPSKVTLAEGGSVSGTINAAAKNGNTYYSTVTNAVEEATNGNTIELVQDTTEDVVIPAGSDVTLDLNGKKLTNVNSHTIFNKGTLTINGNKGTVDNVTHGKVAVYNIGKVTLNGGTYDRSKENGIKDSNTYYTLLNHGTMTVANVTVNNKGGYSSLFENGYFDYNKSRDGIDNPTLTIESGTFTGGINTVKNDDGATMTINGGIFTNYAQSAFQNHNIATINGGTFNGATVYAILNCGTGCKSDVAPDLHQLTITGGNFNGKIYKGGDSKDGKTHYDIGSISISGGYFTTDPSAYCVTGKTGVPSGNTTYPWTVGTKSATKADVAVGAPAVNDPDVSYAEGSNEKTLLDNAQIALKTTAPGVTGTGVETAASAAANKNTVTANDEVVTKLNNQMNGTSATKDNTNIVIQTYMDMTIAGVDATANKQSISVEIQPMYRTVATTADVNNGDEIVLKADGAQTVNAVQIGQPQKLDVQAGYPVEVKIPLPTGFVTENLKVKHEKNGKLVGYHDAIYNAADNTITFINDKGFSTFTVLSDARSTTIQFTDKDNHNIGSAKSYGPSNVNDALPTTAAESGYVFNGWKFEGIDGVYTTLTDELLTKLAAKSGTVSATPDFSKRSSGSSGGSSSGKTTYKVTTSAVNNGGVNASPSNAEKGATITITLSPDKGYKLDKLTVTDGSGKSVSTVKKSDTVYTFTMPASAVKVGVSYVKATETPSKTKFNDVSANDWFASAVDYVTGKGMMNGTADNTFSPKANTTRGMVVTVLYRLENQPSTSAASFTDVASGAYYANAVAWANANGIVSGYGSGKFGPNDKVTREQLAAILYRYAQYKKYDVSVGEDTNILSYNDAQSISSYAIPAIQWACGAGVVTGKSGSKLDPKGNATRAEVAAMLMRFCENVK